MSEKPSRKKRVDSPEPTAVIRELMAQPGIKKIRVFKNGDQYHHGVQMIINDRQVQDLDVFLTAVTRRIDLPFGAKKLYTTNGTHIKDLRGIHDGKDYVASSGLFTPLPYGGVKQRRAKSVDPERKKKKKKKRAASVAPAKHIEAHRESSKEIEIPVEPPKKKKVKKIKKKKEKKEEEHLPGTRPVSRHEDRKEEDHHTEEEKEGHHEEPARSVSRYAHRAPTRAESRMHWKDTSIDEDGEKTEEEHGHGHGRALSDYDSEVESEREGILPSEIHIPFNDSINEGIRNLEIEDAKSTLGRHSDHIQETARMTRDKIVKEANDTEKAIGDAVDKKRKSVYHWGDLSSFTKNIESLLKRKE